MINHINFIEKEEIRGSSGKRKGMKEGGHLLHCSSLTSNYLIDMGFSRTYLTLYTLANKKKRQTTFGFARTYLTLYILLQI